MTYPDSNLTFVDYVTPVPASWLNYVNQVVNTTGLINYTAPFTGADSRTNTSKFSDIVSVLDFGADPTGVADSTTAMQAAHNTGRLVYYPAGTYKNSGTVTMTAGGVYGDGQNLTYINTSVLSSDLFTWNGAGSTTPQGAAAGPVFHDFTINSTAGATASAGNLIGIEPSVGEISYFQIYNITFNGGFNHIGTTAASHYKIHDNNFLNYNNNGILMQNTNNPDSGDSCVYGNLFNCGFIGTSAQAGIQHISSSGTKIFGNKFLGGRYNYFMNANMPGGQGLGGVYLVGNSMEAASVASIQMNRTSASGLWGGIVIASNEFGGAPDTIVCNAAGFTSNVNVTGNVFTQIPTGGVGIILDNQFDWSISNNKFEGSNSGTIGINTGAGVTSLHIGINSYTQLATPVGIGAPSQTTMDLTPQITTASVTTSTPYSALYVGSTNITWPKAFLVAPTTFSSNILSTGSGGISVLVTNATTTGATISVVGITNGGSVPVSVTAFGIA